MNHKNIIFPFFLFLLTVIISPGHGNTYFIAKTGNDINIGTSVEQAFLTITKGTTLLTPGDSLLILEGIYAESFYNDIPGGISWEESVYISNYSDQKVVIRPGTGQFVFNFSDSDSKYIIINGLIINALGIERDAIKITSGSDGASRSNEH